MSAESFGEEEEEEEEEEESDLEGTAPTPKRRKLARGKALTNSLGSGFYPVFMGIEGPSHDANPGDSNALDYLSLLWPATLCELIALETNRYALVMGSLLRRAHFESLRAVEAKNSATINQLKYRSRLCITANIALGAWSRANKLGCASCFNGSRPHPRAIFAARYLY